MTILKNTLNVTQLHFTGANGSVVVAGNSAASNVAFSTQTVGGASIRKIISNGAWTIKRGANVVWTTSGTYVYDFAAHDVVLSQDKAATIVCEVTGAGSIVVEISKESI